MGRDNRQRRKDSLAESALADFLEGKFHEAARRNDETWAGTRRRAVLGLIHAALNHPRSPGHWLPAPEDRAGWLAYRFSISTADAKALLRDYEHALRTEPGLFPDVSGSNRARKPGTTIH